jgi:hypothetical protein
MTPKFLGNVPASFSALKVLGPKIHYHDHQEMRTDDMGGFKEWGQTELLYKTPTRAVWKLSSHFEYLENRSRGLDVTWQPVGGDLTGHP